MAAGEYFTRIERQQIDACIRAAEQLSRCEFSVFVGCAEGEPRAFATQLHNSLVAPARSIVIMVDPTAKAVEVVWGGWTRERLSDDDVAAAIATMTSTFAAGDLAGGVISGIEQLAASANS
ncbi:DUF5130 family protein [Nocardioides limicola]|uniref:DUF5130 family protein n=1 Tax=Nocardioides limicola TaxID=2803368 RepID=UPI00193B2B45|nr:DUF5130 family protein [Nocardioides sp. DJM-14]